MSNKLEKYPYELDESFEMRKLFINKYDPKTEQQFTEAKRLALIWVNFKFLRCIYPIEVMNEIQRILEPKKIKIRVKKNKN